MTKRKLDIFGVLEAIDSKDIEYFSRLDQDKRKAFMPFLVQRWMSGTDDPVQIQFLNEFVNKYTFALQEHKELLYKLMCVVSSGNQQRYQWKGTAKSTSANAVDSLISIEYNVNRTEARQLREILTNDHILELADQHGLQSDELKLIRKELKDCARL